MSQYDDYINNINEVITNQVIADSINPVVIGNALTDLATITKNSVTGTTSGSTGNFTSGFTINLPDNTTGLPNGTVINPGDSIEVILKSLLIKASHPTYVEPTLNLSANVSPSNNYEVGQTLNITFTTAFTQNNAGVITSSVFNKNGTPFTGLTDTLIISTSNVSYQDTVNYAQGSVLNDSLGNPDSTGQIQSGSINSNTLTYYGYYALFIGAVPNESMNSNDAITGLTKYLTSQGNSYTLNTGTEFNIFEIILPSGHTLNSVIDEDALNSVITTDYILKDNNFIVNDIGGTPISGYSKYVKQLGDDIFYSVNHRHLINIS